MLEEPDMKVPIDRNGVGQAEPGTGAASRYDDDLLYANWNPALAVLASFRDGTENETAHTSAHATIESDIDGFLDRVYALATHL
jgi:hypothetical protein